MIYYPDKRDKNQNGGSIPTAFAATNYRMLRDPRNTEICDLTAKSTRARRGGPPSESPDQTLSPCSTIDNQNVVAYVPPTRSPNRSAQLRALEISFKEK